MAIKTFKPTTLSRRHMTVSAFEGIDKKAKPERSLTEVLSKHAGRNSYGRITVRHRGGGNKQKYRIIDFKRDKEGKATVVNLQYDPNRSANIALIEYELSLIHIFPNCRGGLSGLPSGLEREQGPCAGGLSGVHPPVLGADR